MDNPFDLLHQEIRHLQGQMSDLLARPTVVAAGPELPITIDEAAKLLNISKSAVYKNIDVIPHRKHHGQYYFFQSELLDYLKGDKPQKEPKTIQQPRPVRTRKKDAITA